MELSDVRGHQRTIPTFKHARETLFRETSGVWGYMFQPGFCNILFIAFKFLFLFVQCLPFKLTMYLISTLNSDPHFIPLFFLGGGLLSRRKIISAVMSVFFLPQRQNI